jgi:penicillin-binding protein 1B
LRRATIDDESDDTVKTNVRKILKLSLVSLAFFTLIFGVSIAVWIWHIDQTWSPLIEPRIKERQSLGSIRVLAKDKFDKPRWIGSLTSGRFEERQFLKLSEVPPQLVQAIVVLEDPRFLEHGGLDVRGIFRALVTNILALRMAQGGSTVTQQLVKNVFLTSEKTLKRKFTEWVLAALVERRFSKDEILEAYINEVYLGQLGSVQIHGVGRASEYYFGKKVEQLEVHEMALLAAMIAGPGVYSPWRSPDKTRARRDRVLKSLAEANLILPEELQNSLVQPLPGPSSFVASTRAAYLMDALRERLLQERGELALVKGGFDVQLGLDLELQEMAEKNLAELFKSDDPNVQAVVLGGDPRTCEIRVYVGGTNYRVTQLDRIRQSQRPIGSLMKPLEMATLLDQDDTLNLATLVNDQELEWSFDGGRNKWSPQNYDRKFRGPVTVRQTLEESLNVPIARIFFERYPDGLLQEAFDPLRAMGLVIPEDRALPSALLGAVDQSPLTMLTAYLKLARRALGLADTPADLECRPSFEALLDPSLVQPKDSARFGQNGARLVLGALEGAIRRGTSKSLGQRLPLNQTWSGKTGTSSDKRDAWYAALSPGLVLIAWQGRDDNKVTKHTGLSGAVPLVQPLIESYAKREGISTGFAWPKPERVQWKLVKMPERCRLSDIQEKLLMSKTQVPEQATPPPEPFQIEGTLYAFELFRDGAWPKECL